MTSFNQVQLSLLIDFTAYHIEHDSIDKLKSSLIASAMEDGVKGGIHIEQSNILCIGDLLGFNIAPNQVSNRDSNGVQLDIEYAIEGEVDIDHCRHQLESWVSDFDAENWIAEYVVFSKEQMNVLSRKNKSNHKPSV